MEKALRIEGKRLQRQIDALSAAPDGALTARIDRLERLLTEHPKALALTAPARPLGSPAVSVITPTWNRAAIVGAAIRSVQAQTFTDWELIVVDDGGTDDTASVVASFADDPRIRFAMIPHGGQCRARNHGLRLARGSLIAYLDSDNVWYPDFLAAITTLFEARPAVDCAYGAMVTEAHGGVTQGRILFEPFDRTRLLRGNFIGMSTFVHRHSLVERYGGFDETLDGLEDWDLILRYTSHEPATALPVLAVRYRTVDEQRVTVTRRLGAAEARVRAKWGS
jgi:glycosyltransferase involved in cell wall biosynthesis